MAQQTKSPARRRWRWLVVSLSLAVLFAAAAVWWVSGRAVWTDGLDLRLPAGAAQPRQVLWLAPSPLQGVGFNTSHDEYEPCLSPDETELFFVRGKAGENADIYISHRRNNMWTEPRPLAAVNSPADDLGPRLTPDGNTLLFYSNRAGGLGQYDIWAAPRTAEGFGPAVNLGPGVNSPYCDYSPAPSPDGRRLYFATNRVAAARQPDAWRATIRQSEVGDYDLFVATAVAPGTATRPATPAFDDAAPLAGVNTPYHEGACCVAPGGDFLYFASNRPGGVGGFDLYRARINADGTLAASESLGGAVNTVGNDVDPFVAAGGFRLYFSSDRRGSRGGYDLLSADSREVFASRQSRGQLAWSWWVLLAALLVLLPLLSYFRNWDERRYSLLQKCLLLSLLLHVLLTIVFTTIKVSQEIVAHLKREGGMELAVNLDVSREVEVGLAARQMISELTTAVPPPPAPKRLETPAPPTPPPPAPAMPSRLLPTPVRLAKMQLTPEPRPRPEVPTPQVAMATPAAVPTPMPLPAPDLPRPRPERVSEDVPRPALLAVPELRPQPIEAPVSTEPQPVRVTGLPVRAIPQALAQPIEAPLPSRPAVTVERVALPRPTELTAPVLAVTAPSVHRPTAVTDAAATATPALRPNTPDVAGPVASLAPSTRPRVSSLASTPVTLRTPEALTGAPSPPRPALPTDLLARPVPLADMAMAPVPRDLRSPEALMPRSFEQRQERIEKLGGSPQSERAVARALAFLQRTQESDGRWTLFTKQHGGRREPYKHDAALTGLATLCFLGADHKPTDQGLYSQTVAKAIDYLLARQKADGDLRGGGDMYDHAIAAIAVTEAAIMTRDQRYREAAEKAIRFVETAQNPKTGGWRYLPRQADSDTSVLGWQVMALRSGKTLGVKLDPQVWNAATESLKSVSGGRTGILAGYQGAREPTPTMSAEAALCRVLLEVPISPAQLQELGEYLLRDHLPRSKKDKANYYFWYYGSLSLMHLQGETWTKWNAAMRDHLITTQRAGGDMEGSWEPDCRWAGAGGRVYTTALATLTLEVYYRFLPMYGRDMAGDKPASGK